MYVHQCGMYRADFPQVQNKSHLLALSRVCKQFRSLIFPRLFEVLTIKPYDELLLWDLEWYPFFDQDMVSRVPKVFTAVKELYFAAPFYDTDLAGHENVKRCPHFSIRESNSSPFDSPSSEDDGLSLLEGGDSVYENEQENIMSFEELFDFEHGDYGLMKLSKKIIRLLSVLPDDQLSSFR